MNTTDAVRLLQDAFWREGERLLFHHTNPWELDEALCAWGYLMGPCEAQDLIGLDKVLARDPARPVPILPRMVAEGRMGKSGGVGYYRYPGGGGAVIDPLIEDLILEEAWFGKVPRVEVSDEELLTHMNAALRNACKVLRTNGMAEHAITDALREAVHLSEECNLDWAR